MSTLDIEFGTRLCDETFHMNSSQSDPFCPNCKAQDFYHDGTLWICPICNHEWTEFASVSQPESSKQDPEPNSQVKDAHGTVLSDGDSITVIKDLPVKGASGPIKSGTKAKNIRLAFDVPGHNIVCKIEGFGQIHLKSEFVKKSN